MENYDMDNEKYIEIVITTEDGKEEVIELDLDGAGDMIMNLIDAVSIQSDLIEELEDELKFTKELSNMLSNLN